MPKSYLTKYEIIPEEWGGENIFVEVSAKEGSGIDNLLDSISLLSGVNRGFFGGGQIININEEGVLIGGSDPRKDGLSVSY